MSSEIFLHETSRLYAPVYREAERNGQVLLIDPESPHWIVTDRRGARIIADLDGRRTFGEIVAGYCRAAQVDWAKGWLHCHTFLGNALRSGFLSPTPFIRAPYPGRAEALEIDRLSELWLHVTNACNLSCSHCLVDSSPSGIPGEKTGFWLRTIDQARALGVTRFYITGGEPFLRNDLFDLIARITTEAELVVLTNAIPLRGKRLKKLSECDSGRLTLQISLDGPTAAINDPIRGSGSFDATLRGIKEVIGIGLNPTLTTVVTRANVASLPEMVELASSLGVKNFHLLLRHHRGRGVGSDALASPSNTEIREAFLKVVAATEQSGIRFDNLDALKSKLLGRPGVKRDLSNAGYESLCVYADGAVYPSAALAGLPAFRMGSLSDGLENGAATRQPLETIWKTSQMARQIRSATVQKKSRCKDCYLKYLCGGGDLEHTVFYSGQFLGEDPFSEFYEEWIIDTLLSHAEKRSRQKTPSGYDRPILFAAMGEAVLEEERNQGARAVGGFEVALSRSACVLSVDLDHSRRVVSDFYGAAAETPQPALCCPGGYPQEDSSHIPKEVLEIAYGCGSPVGLAGIAPGETMVDLGSGGGIDCFIAAKKVGPEGRVLGIDMTDAMLERAREAKGKVAANLGYDIVEFRKGYLEEIPLPDRFADVITSNCVINLSPDKKQVFVEMWRVLKDFGRIVVSDTVAERALPPGMKANPRLWGECVSGALTETEYLSRLEEAGFYGLAVIKKNLWKEVKGYLFYSVVIRGFKYEKKQGCNYIGQTAIYLGPMQGVIDEEGHHFPRNQPVEICTDTAAKLKRPPYAGSFEVIEGNGAYQTVSPPTAAEEEACCPPGQCC
ncbi:MAG: methyltransferase domain-containing protein [Candidatus Manganitrophus sp. SA1]|nr:methyltransferase domain-containing protein [Candidatus Manganitrophus morganii]